MLKSAQLNNCCTRRWHGNLMYVYLIETKTVHSSAFPAIFYLTLVLSTILIRSTTWIRWRPGICRLQARVRVHQPPRSKDCEKLVGGLRTHLIQCGRLGTRLPFDRSNVSTQAWWGQTVTSWDRSFTLWGRSEVGRQIVADSHHRVWQAGHKSRPSVGKCSNPLIFHPYNQL